MADFSKFQHSKNLLERAAYYAAATSWTDATLFEQAQKDADALLELSKQKTPKYLDQAFNEGDGSYKP